MLLLGALMIGLALLQFRHAHGANMGNLKQRVETSPIPFDACWAVLQTVAERFGSPALVALGVAHSLPKMCEWPTSPRIPTNESKKLIRSFFAQIRLRLANRPRKW